MFVGDTAALAGKGETADFCGEGFLVILLAIVGDTAGLCGGGETAAFGGEGFLLILVAGTEDCCRRTGSKGAIVLPARVLRGAVPQRLA